MPIRPRPSFAGGQEFTERDHNRIQLDAVLRHRAQIYLKKVDFSPLKDGKVSPSGFIESVAAESPADISNAVRVTLAVLLGIVVFNTGLSSSEAHADSVADKLAAIDDELAAMERDSNRNQDIFIDTMDSSIDRIDTDEQSRIIKILESDEEILMKKTY
jgi:hypothetical protein